MGGLIDTLGVSYSGLLAARAGIQVTSHNVSNAQTEGYHRRTLAQSPIGGIPIFGGGVHIDGVIRAEDRILGGQRQSSEGRQGYASARQSLLIEAENALGSIDEGGISDSISKLFSAFSSLSSSPNDSSVRANVLSAASSVAQAFNDASDKLSALQSSADKSIAITVDQANELIKQVAALNAKIVAAEAAGADAGDLKDQQALMITELAANFGVKTFLDDENQTTVLLGGMSLVQGDHYATLQTEPDASLNGMLRVDLVDGSTRTDMTSLIGGSVGGAISVRDQSIPNAIADLDQLAFDLATAINTQHAAGFGLDGSTGLDFFTIPATAPTTAGNIEVNAALTNDSIAASATAAGVPGDADNAHALSDLANSQIAAGNTKTATSQAAAIISGIGGQVDQAISEAQSAGDELINLQERQESVEGVSLDEEMVHMVQYQRAYQASARMLKVVDTMLAQLMEL